MPENYLFFICLAEAAFEVDWDPNVENRDVLENISFNSDYDEVEEEDEDEEDEEDEDDDDDEEEDWIIFDEFELLDIAELDELEITEDDDYVWLIKDDWLLSFLDAAKPDNNVDVDVGIDVDVYCSGDRVFKVSVWLLITDALLFLFTDELV